VLEDLQLTTYRVEALRLEAPRRNSSGDEVAGPGEEPGFSLTLRAKDSPQAWEFSI
jgi:hypothetical protein